MTESIDTTSPGGRLAHLFSALAQFERELIKERTNARLAAARAGGRHGGRPHGVQINKTTRNTVLSMTNIGTTRSMVASLIEVARDDRQGTGRPDHGHEPERTGGVQTAVLELTNPSALLPDFSGLHPAFRTDGGSQTPGGDAMPIRSFRLRMHGSWLTSFRTQPLHVFAAGHVEPLAAAWDFGPVITRLLLRKRPSHRATGQRRLRVGHGK